MPDKSVTFLPMDHPDATAVTDLLNRAREDRKFTNVIISAAAHMIAANALDKGITCPEEATEHFKSVVEMSILANQKTVGST